jgi:hypothetical protein
MRAWHPLPLSALLATATACDAGEKPAPEGDAACTLTAAPLAAAPALADANGDGFVDVSDGVFVLRSFFVGGPAPACTAAVDFVPDGSFDAGDGFGLLYTVGPKTVRYPPDLDVSACAAPTRAEEPACGDGLALGIDAPATVTGSVGTQTTFDASVTLASPVLDVEAWSFTLVAEGCQIAAATTAGTVAADRADATGGLRDGGMAWQSVASDTELQVLTVLNWRDTTAVAHGGTASAIHAVTVMGTPTADCAPCELRLVAGDPATGVESVASGGGYRYVPALGSATVQLCAE